MKSAIAVFILVAVLCRAEEGYSSKIRHILEQLREEKTPDGEPLISGQSQSYGGQHGAFFLLGPYVCTRATNEDLALMAKDKSPVVRILAAKRISMMTMFPAYRPEALTLFSKDREMVYIGPLDAEKDTFRRMTVADVVQALISNPHFLPLAFYFEEEEPNQHLKAAGQGKSGGGEVSGGPPSPR